MSSSTLSLVSNASIDMYELLELSLSYYVRISFPLPYMCVCVCVFVSQKKKKKKKVCPIVQRNWLNQKPKDQIVSDGFNC